MEKLKQNKLALAALFLVVGLLLGYSWRSDGRYDKDFNSKRYLGGDGYMMMDGMDQLGSWASSAPKEEVSAKEQETLVHMREEEKLARDVYQTLYEKWGARIFANISMSEEMHMSAVEFLLSKYDIDDPVKNNAIGSFTNTTLRELYTNLVTKGSVSLNEALRVGAMIEDLDIKDLKVGLLETDNNDIEFVYNNLMQGSENHMRAFVSQLESRGETYTPEYISEEEYKAIIGSNNSKGWNKGGSGRGMMGW